MSLYLGTTPICGGIEGNQLNNPFSLLDYKFSEYEISNASWLRSNGQYNSGSTYADVYNLLLQIKNGTVTKAGVSVKLSTETYADTDFVLNTSDTTFRLPLKVALASGKAVAGNGMTLGLTDGTNLSGLTRAGSGSNSFEGTTSAYGEELPTTGSGNIFGANAAIGITTDTTKSGIETSANGLYLYFYVGAVIQDASVIAAANVLNDVANLKAHYIVETYHNGTSWYRVYSDGWCEQGGLATTSQSSVIFALNFTDTNYNILLTPHTSGSNGTYFEVTNISTTGFDWNYHRASTSVTVYGVYWQACGYIS